jgi:hypothetical protein
VTGVGVDSDGLVLGEADGVAFSPDQLLASVAGHLAEKRVASARREVQWYPDVAWQLLRGPVPAADATALRAIAAAHDAQCVRGRRGCHLADAVGRPSTTSRSLPEVCPTARRVPGRRATGTAAPGVGHRINPPAGDQLPKLIAIDAWQLTGMALMLDDRPSEAAAAFQRGVELAEREYPYYEAQLRLQWSEALRHAGQIVEADAAWSDAVRVAHAGWLAEPPLRDPDYLERLAYHRPVDRPWPPELVETLAGLAARYGVASGDVHPVDSADNPCCPTNGISGPVWAIGVWSAENLRPLWWR